MLFPFSADSIWARDHMSDQCSGLNSHISLRHSKFNASEKPYGECNNGAIAARAIGVVDNHYTSQLNVTLSPEMNNRTMECIYDNGTETIVGSAVLAFTTGTYYSNCICMSWIMCISASYIT